MEATTGCNELKMRNWIPFSHSLTETIWLHRKLFSLIDFVYIQNGRKWPTIVLKTWWIFQKQKSGNKQTIDWDSRVNGTVCVEMIVPLALTLHIQPERYCLHCHLNEWSVHLWFRRLVFRWECEVFAVTLDLMLKNYATSCTAEQESPILNQNVQSLCTVSKSQH